MAVLDGVFGTLAQTLIGQFGRTATLTRAPAGESGYTGQAPAGSATVYPCSIVFEEYADSQVDGTVIKRGDRKAIVSRLALGTAPLPDRDTLTEGGRAWRIVRVLGYSSGEQEAAYSLQVRL
jgi:hypothetical protein